MRERFSDPREAYTDGMDVSMLQWDRSHHKCYIIFYQIAELNIKRMDNELRYPLFSVQNTFQHFWQTARHRDTIEQPAIILASNRQLNLHNYVSLHYLASWFSLARTANSKLQQIFMFAKLNEKFQLFQA